MNELIEKHLYHRAPNLLLENIVEIDQKGLKSSLHLTETHPLIVGHFPGLPIFPGTQMLEMLIQSAGLYMSEIHYPDHRNQKLSVGIFRKCEQATFKNMARPSQTLTATIKQTEQIGKLHQFQGEVRAEDQTVLMKAKFALTVVEEEVLRGN